MRAVVQRVSAASVVIEGQTVASIGGGLLILLGVFEGDSADNAAALAQKTALLRIFCDADDKMNLSVLDTDGAALVVSNFTLCADTSHGRRPSFIAAARPETADPLYQLFCRQLRQAGVREVQTGVFGADMAVSLTNDGPVTLILDA